MAQIDPPYRFDPLQNLVNIHWERGTGLAYDFQVFIWRRWIGLPENNGHRGDWYPITDAFYSTIFAANQVERPVTLAEIAGGRAKLSDLIVAATTISAQWNDHPRDDDPFGTFAWYWDNVYTLATGEPTTQPNTVPPNHQFCYLSTILGAYGEDDMSTQDWADLALGVGKFQGVPEFIPPQLP